MKLFSKVLIANRGEIAVRIIRACRELGIKTVAIYSSADSKALHTLMADEAYFVGPPPPPHSYLNIDKILAIAKRAEVDAIHPGYGFLSQNPEFAKRCEEEGIKFIGPPASVHLFSGDKLGAKLFLEKEGIPVIPGSRKPLKSVLEACEVAENVGYPIILKPRLGGGGIGMKICHNENELRENFKASLRLASSSFKSSELYIERYYPGARHIEVQILADEHRNIVHLFERECSIQRRFQKLVEEAPSPILNEDLRERVTRMAIRVARLINYVNAGTIEFLYIPNEEKFLFLEVNSRIQVEHPVTEMITGIDIVKEQIKIAAGELLEYCQEDIEIKGHAIEARICAEDPFSGFIPSPGIITDYIPPKGIGVRVDDGIYPGSEIPPYYDPLIAKLIVWGRNREEAIMRMYRALNEFIIEGVKTNIPLHLALLKDKAFIKGRYDTRYLEEVLIPRGIPYKPPSLRIPVLHRYEKEESPHLEHISWKLSGRIMDMRHYTRLGKSSRISF